MKPLVRILSLAGLSTFVACATTPIQSTDEWGNPKFSVATEDPLVQQRHDAVARHNSLVSALSLLSGRFQGTSPENDLGLEFERVRDPRTASVSLRVMVSGLYRGQTVRRSDLLSLQSHATSPDAAYFLDFDPATASVAAVGSRTGGPRVACAAPLKPDGDGFRAEISCGKGFPAATGRWAIEIQPGKIRLRSLESNESLEFSKLNDLRSAASR
jgi:hypothetical protein